LEKFVSILTKLIAIALVLSFLNIHIQTGYDTVNAIWNFIYPVDGQNILLTVASYMGIALTLYSAFFRNKLTLYLSYLGLVLLWASFIYFYPNYWSKQRETFINPQYLFVLWTVILLTINFWIIFKRQTLIKSEQPSR
jgi:hypothetical protein